MGKLASLKKSLLCQIVVGLAFLGFLYFAYIGAFWSQDYLEQVVNQWNSPMISDVQLVNGKGCPDGYELSTYYYWAGNEAGCDCSEDRVDFYPPIRKGVCSQNETMYGCRDVASRSPTKMSLISGQTLCIQRSSTISYAEADRPTKEDGKLKCQSGARLCGYESDDYALCIPEENKCPVTNI